LPKTGDSITVLNEQTSYDTWEFIYDPRIEQMKAKAALLGGGVGSTPASSFGSGSGLGGFPGSNTNSPAPGAATPSGTGGTTPSPTNPQ
jgi:hypothetical protein